jgi:hypothetical protein
MTKVVVEESPVRVSVYDEVYGVVVQGDGVNVSVSESIIREVAAEDEVYDIEIDTSVSGVTYVGEAAPGTAASQALWRVKKITETVGGSSVDWAGGAATFTHVWNDHLTLTYGP